MAAIGLILSLIILLLVQDQSNGYCFNHQTDTYNAQQDFSLKTCSSSATCSITPFLSPDNSLEAHLQLIEEAQESISIANPTFLSWIRQCDLYHGDCEKEGYCTGCELSNYRNNETFPLFAALLNAINLRNINVRILTNNYSVPTCQNKATILDWLSINRASVRMYKTTSFLHAKFMMIDGGKKVLVSSVNFSRTSFMRNRESGVIISECIDCDVSALYRSVFDYDWTNSDDYVLSNVYTNQEIDFMTDTSRYPSPLVLQPSQRIPNITTMNLTTFSGVQISGYVSPDYARETFFAAINQTKNSLKLHIYEVTDMEICHQLINLKNNGVDVTLIVSLYVSDPRETIHKKCYQELTKQGITVVYSSKKFRYSHQKYWIIDNKTVHLSTGNWAESDFPSGETWAPHRSGKNINRDMLVIMENSILISEFFDKVFRHDLDIGTPMKVGITK